MHTFTHLHIRMSVKAEVDAKKPRKKAAKITADDGPPCGPGTTDSSSATNAGSRRSGAGRSAVASRCYPSLSRRGEILPPTVISDPSQIPFPNHDRLISPSPRRRFTSPRCCSVERRSYLIYSAGPLHIRLPLPPASAHYSRQIPQYSQPLYLSRNIERPSDPVVPVLIF